jgi:hypothetical protein
MRKKNAPFDSHLDIGFRSKENLMFAPGRALAIGLFVGFGFLTQNAAFAQTEIPGVGSWKLNVSKSKLGSEPAPQSITSTVKPSGQGVKITGVRIGADGIRTECQYTANYDGKDYPITGSKNADTVSLKKVDSRTIERTDKKAGKVVETSTTVFSEDGKSCTTTGKARNLHGEDFHFVIVNDRVAKAD